MAHGIFLYGSAVLLSQVKPVAGLSREAASSASASIKFFEDHSVFMK